MTIAENTTPAEPLTPRTAATEEQHQPTYWNLLSYIVSNAIAGEINKRMGAIDDAFVMVLSPPPVSGLGTTGGFKMMIEDRTGLGYPALAQAAFQMMMGANQQPAVAGAFTPFNVGTPRLVADIDRERAERMGVPVQNIFSTLNAYLGSAYVNDFNFLGRTFRVTAQADRSSPKPSSASICSSNRATSLPASLGSSS